jgi:hypothetical protein
MNIGRRPLWRDTPCRNLHDTECRATLFATRSVAPHCRAGVVLAATLACLFLAILLSAGLAASALTGHRRMAQQAERQQAACLADSAASRAAAQLRRNPGYEGETWTIPAADLDGIHAGRAMIAVAADEENAGRRRVTIEVHYPDDPVHRTQVTKEIVVRVPAEESE